ncbi:beta strand repeat-containing protein [Flavobacterium channae]|uniref:beta strand repeat-containing protein n=1 Tax=Flavobacterium channae TaxID=2897181 RepID=UPI001E3DAB42|nr:tail fiber domain-containing protein [Flavobacterium channae]UGS22977.1 tail fiber domain-containing protein [Flavobacterium channae]
MKKKLFLAASVLFGTTVFAQVGINTTAPNAQLDIRATSATAPSNTDGLLIPKIDVFPATNPTAAQQGMLLYLTTTSGSNAPGFYYWDNPTATWIGLGKDVKAWQLNGNTVNATTDFMGSTNNADVIFKRNNIRAGRLGDTNTSFGKSALNPATTGAINTAIGHQSLLSNTSGNYNVAVGNDALKANLTGSDNLALGSGALFSNTLGNGNTAFGNDALFSNLAAYDNIGIGRRALFSNTNGSRNLAVGFEALRNHINGSNNAGFGNNTAIGNSLTNATAIGANASATTSNSLVLGSINGDNGATASTNVGIGTTAPNAILEVKAVNPAAPANTEGLLIPRVSVFPATNPTAAQHGMQVFLTTAVGTQQPGFYYWDDPTTSWVGIGGSASGNNWALAGNTVNATTDFMGSTNDADVIFKRNNVRAGRIGIENTSFGVDALNPASTGSRNTATGVASLSSNTTGTDNTASGYLSLSSNTTGSQNTGIGYNTQTGSATNVLTNTTAIGANASATTSNSLVLGSINGVNGATASANVGIGTTAPNAALEVKAVNPAAPTNTEGLLIPRVSAFPATNPTVAQHGMQVFLTTAVGANQPGFYYWNNPTTSWISIGGSTTGNNWALAGNTVNATTDFMGSTNNADVIFKRNNVRAGSLGFYNVSLGVDALVSNVAGNGVAAFGYYSLRSSTGSYNTAIGAGSSMYNTTGVRNTALGNAALRENATGSENTAVGAAAFQNVTAYSNSTALGYSTVILASNQVRLGNYAVTSIGGQVSWTTLSDARFKIENTKKVPGIDFIKKLRPVTYYVNHEAMNAYLNAGRGKESGDSVANVAIASGDAYKPTYTKTLESGFMAQEVEQASKELGYEFNGVDAPKNEKDYYGLRYSQFVVPLVKAVQELNEKLEQKQAENDQLKAMLLELEKRIAKLEKNASN